LSTTHACSTNQRNGNRHRDLDTRAGTIDVAIPNVRHGSCFPDWLPERRKRAEAALISVVATCYLLGVSTTFLSRSTEDLRGSSQDGRIEPSSLKSSPRTNGLKPRSGTNRSVRTHGGKERYLEQMDLTEATAQMDRRIKARQAAGIATAVVTGGDVIESCCGMLDLERGVPVEPDSLMRIYSLSKPVIAVAAMLLHERGLLNLDDPVRVWIPSFAELHTIVGKPVESDITIRHLLTHTSGLPNWFDEGPAEDACREANLMSPLLQLNNPLPTTMNLISHLPLVFQPGTSWRYSVSFEVLGYLIELIGGQPLTEFLREEIFSPLGMVDTGFSVPAAALDRFGPLYGPPEEGLLPIVDQRLGSPFTEKPLAPSGGGGLVSTLQDYVHFARMLGAGGILDGMRILRADSVRAMSTNQLRGTAFPIRWGDEPDDRTGYGLGVGVGVGEPARFGWGGAAGTQMWIYPDHDLIVVALTQSMFDFTVTDAFIAAVITSELGLEPQKPVF
jgi:CubicO group peptidase (beta-lactamase class C family)